MAEEVSMLMFLMLLLTMMAMLPCVFSFVLGDRSAVRHRHYLILLVLVLCFPLRYCARRLRRSRLPALVLHSLFVGSTLSMLTSMLV